MKADKTDINKKKMIEALEMSLGVVTSAVKAVGIHRSTHYEWYNEDTEYRKAVDDIVNVSLDFAETQLFQSMKDQNVAAVIFYLKTKGKQRGYIERSEFEFKKGEPDLSELTTEEIRAMLNDNNEAGNTPQTAQ
ncbi:MAG: hypothetical protein LW688_13860 [Cryomorphaceae bacterium]|jgi:hypothetical protein|nr:hypothetical protein [Cryomorphaceae bacterium]